MSPNVYVIFVLLALLAVALVGLVHAIDSGWLLGTRPRQRPAQRLALPALAKRGPNRRHRRRQQADRIV